MCFERIVFLVGGRYKEKGSSVLRGYQLSQICKIAFASKYFDVRVADNALAYKNSLLFLTKSFLWDTKPNDIKQYRANGNSVCVDFLDDPPVEFVINECDFIISSSYRQHQYYKSKYQNKSIVHITHHVDLRIVDTPALGKHFRCGYFGEPSNALLSDNIGSLDVIPVSNPHDSAWISKLQHYNCHYLLRRSHRDDGFKPFTKGFTAASMGSPVIVSRSDVEALHYLGASYPFAFMVNSVEDAVSAVASVAEQFGGPTWLQAVQDMESLRMRSSLEVVREELRKLLYAQGVVF